MSYQCYTSFLIEKLSSGIRDIACAASTAESGQAIRDLAGALGRAGIRHQAGMRTHHRRRSPHGWRFRDR